MSPVCGVSMVGSVRHDGDLCSVNAKARNWSKLMVGDLLTKLDPYQDEGAKKLRYVQCINCTTPNNLAGKLLYQAGREFLALYCRCYSFIKLCILHGLVHCVCINKAGKSP